MLLALYHYLKRPLIVTSVTGEAAWRDFVAADGKHPHGDVFELRLDTLPADIPLSTVAALHPNKPVLLTPRAADEGGAKDWSAAERMEAIRPLLPLATAVDWEICHLAEVPELSPLLQEQHISLVASAHDFSETPEAGEMIAMDMDGRVMGADIVKYAFTLRKKRDIDRGITYLRHADGPAAAMGMGPLGLVSRLLYCQSGSCLLYCSYSGCEAAVPGQMPDALAEQLLPLLQIE